MNTYKKEDIEIGNATGVHIITDAESSIIATKFNKATKQSISLRFWSVKHY